MGMQAGQVEAPPELHSNSEIPGHGMPSVLAELQALQAKLGCQVFGQPCKGMKQACKASQH